MKAENLGFPWMQDPMLMDQPPLRYMLCSGSKRLSNNTCSDPVFGSRSLMLPTDRFLKGKKLLEFLKSDAAALDNIDPFIVHYTGGKVDGAKGEKMLASKMWLLGYSGTCSI